MVIKLVAIDFGHGWVDLLKLSDDPGKYLGPDEPFTGKPSASSGSPHEAENWPSLTADTLASVACTEYLAASWFGMAERECARVRAKEPDTAFLALMNWLRSLLGNERVTPQTDWNVQLRLIEWCWWASRCMLSPSTVKKSAATTDGVTQPPTLLERRSDAKPATWSSLTRRTRSVHRPVRSPALPRASCSSPARTRT
jgi:hypothetical protein